ncbi:MAG: hypothetical protein ACRDBG_11435 [Waterburya sp.]
MKTLTLVKQTAIYSFIGSTVLFTPLTSQSLTTKEVTNPRQDNGGWVTDMAGILSDRHWEIDKAEANNGAFFLISTGDRHIATQATNQIPNETNTITTTQPQSDKSSSPASAFELLVIWAYNFWLLVIWVGVIGLLSSKLKHHNRSGGSGSANTGGYSSDNSSSSGSSSSDFGGGSSGGDGGGGSW